MGGLGVAGMQGILGAADGAETDGQGRGETVGVVSLGGVGVGSHFGSGRVGSAGATGTADDGGAAPAPVWHCGLFGWSHAG